MHSSLPGHQSKFATLCLALMLVALWLVTRGYHGIAGDGRIYAFQALARLHSQLASDLYLQNTSQDDFTIFSPCYAWFVAFLGLENAARLLTIFFTVWLLAAVWSLARGVAGRDAAWLAVAFLLIIAGDYGAAGVFRVLDPYLTARLPAEALIVSALACHVRGRPGLGLLLALAALFVHPLMALPGVLLLICLWLPGRAGLTAAIGGVLTALLLAIIASGPAAASRVPSVMDASWLEVVRERSQFLFLQLWSIRDWDFNVRPFVCLAFTAIAVPDARIRKLCATAALVGISGLALALIASLIGPIAILVQSQAWRWVWIAVFISVVLLPFTALQVWRIEKCGQLCSILLVSGWTLPWITGTACISLALIVWLARSHIDARGAAYCRWASAAVGIVIAIWIVIKCWAIVSPPSSALGRIPSSAARLLDIVALKITAVLFVAMVWHGISVARTTWARAALAAVLVALSIFVFPAAFKQSRTLANAADIDEFADWTKVIPPASTVLIAPPHDAGAFVWFTLNRPNYLASDQSAGVVFSRETALEVRRRSEILLPLMEPDWKVLTSLRARSAGRLNDAAPVRPLTAGNLPQICADPKLGFVISPANIGFGALRHEHPGAWKDWNLYDCRIVRSAPAAT
jgi:hypothetical protein